MQLQKLNFPNTYEFRISKNKGTYFIFDVVRNSEQKLTPEEWVRQHWVHYFLHTQKRSKSVLVVEKQIFVNQTQKRIDLMVNHKNGTEYLIELKASDVKLNTRHFEQIARYNSVIRANKLIISNGVQHLLACFENETYRFETFDFEKI